MMKINFTTIHLFLIFSTSILFELPSCFLPTTENDCTLRWQNITAALDEQHLIQTATYCNAHTDTQIQLPDCEEIPA